MASTNTSSFTQFDNILNTPEQIKEAFASQLKMPSLVASHIAHPMRMHNTIVHATEETLIVYIYREETNRQMAAISTVVEQECVNRNSGVKPRECQMQEGELLKLLQEQVMEMKMGIAQHMTCKTYEVIKDNNPNLIFMHYKMASQLQKLLAKHHCPQVTQEMRENVAAQKNMNISIVLEGQSNNSSLVSLHDWLDAKRQLLELALGLRKHASCQATTKDIQHELLRCRDETLQVSGWSYENHKISFPF